MEKQRVSNVVSTTEYSAVVKKLRAFFDAKNFECVPAQARQSILAACEDPSNISQYEDQGIVWPLPQTGQMWLEHELLLAPKASGYYCETTSYRNEKNPIPGRHNTVFPLFEFESKGSIDDLLSLERDLLKHLGFKHRPVEITYQKACKELGVEQIEAKEEEELAKRLGPVIFLTDFPESTSPFWNMKRKEGTDIAYKVDVLLHGHETFGTAERSCDIEQMRHTFETISEGGYAQILYDKFGKERIDKEMDEFLALPMIPRFGGGIGVTRLISAMKKEGLL